MKSLENIPAEDRQYESLFDLLLQEEVYGVAQEKKEQLLLNTLTLLHNHHRHDCSLYANIFPDEISYHSLESLPYLAVRLFKLLSLKSIPEIEVFKTLYSSGTTSQMPAKIVLDRDTSARQSKVLVKILQEFLGKKRLPMLIIDSADVVKDRLSYSARGAGIQGLSIFGRDHTYALDSDMNPDWNKIQAFCERHAGQPKLIFGFTFMVWQYFIQKLNQTSLPLDLTDATLLHSGGWKKLEAEKVSNEKFKTVIKEMTGIGKVHNFYGMAEQVGSVFVECEQGHLHAPIFADVIVRDPYSFNVCSPGKQGVIQVLSTLPTSYPGQSILTEDLGTLLGIDDCLCGRKGKYFSVQGRLPKTEMRGCSDTHRTN